MADFLPRRDAELADFAQAFASVLAADVDGYRVTTHEAAECTAAAQAYANAVRAAAGGERGVATILRKREARARIETVLRHLSRRVKLAPAVSDEMLAALRLTPRRVSYAKTPRAIPQAPPSVMVVRSEGATFGLMVRPADSGGRWGVPRGVAGVVIEACVSETVPSTDASWKLAGRSRRSRVTLTFGAAVEPGRRVWFRACYQDTRQRSGPWSNMIQRRVADYSMFVNEPARVPAFVMRRVA